VKEFNSGRVQHAKGAWGGFYLEFTESQAIAVRGYRPTVL